LADELPGPSSWFQQQFVDKRSGSEGDRILSYLRVPRTSALSVFLLAAEHTVLKRKRSKK